MNINYIIIFAIIVVIYLIYKFCPFQTEHFNLLDTGVETNDCYSKNLTECVQYSNGGIATIDGRKECIPGDIEGPSFEVNPNFDQWSYKNQYDKHIFNGTEDTRDYNIWSTFYPIYDVFYPSPPTLAALI